MFLKRGEGVGPMFQRYISELFTDEMMWCLRSSQNNPERGRAEGKVDGPGETTPAVTRWSI